MLLVSLSYFLLLENLIPAEPMFRQAFERNVRAFPTALEIWQHVMIILPVPPSEATLSKMAIKDLLCIVRLVVSFSYKM